MAKKLSRAEKIRRYLNAHPDAPLSEIATKFGTTYQIVYMVKRKMPKKIVLHAREVELANKAGVSTVEYAKQRVKILKQPKVKAALWQPPEPLPVPEAITMEEPQSDPVNHPAHYKTGGIETIDFIEAKNLNYNLGNVVKYVTRADHKGNRKQDLEKAQWYLNREIGKL